MRGADRRFRLLEGWGFAEGKVMSDTDEPADDRPGPRPPSSRWADRQKDIGGALFIGAITMVVLLGLLVWKGLF